MTRETKEFTTPQGHKIVINTFITGREQRTLRSFYLKESGELPVEEVKESGRYGAVSKLVSELALRLVVVSVDGHKDGDSVEGKNFSIVNFLLDEVPSSELSFVTKKVNEITSDKDFEEKKTS